jgi:hypothetical protein
MKVAMIATALPPPPHDLQSETSVRVLLLPQLLPRLRRRRRHLQRKLQRDEPVMDASHSTSKEDRYRITLRFSGIASNVDLHMVVLPLLHRMDSTPMEVRHMIHMVMILVVILSIQCIQCLKWLLTSRVSSVAREVRLHMLDSIFQALLMVVMVLHHHTCILIKEERCTNNDPRCHRSLKTRVRLGQARARVPSQASPIQALILIRSEPLMVLIRDSM